MKDLFPTDHAHVRFTDMQGIQREGFYKKSSNGYIEICDLEMPDESKFTYPEDEIVEWEYLEETDPDMNKFVL